MIPKSRYRFSEKDHAPTRTSSGTTNRREVIPLSVVNLCTVALRRRARQSSAANTRFHAWLSLAGAGPIRPRRWRRITSPLRKLISDQDGSQIRRRSRTITGPGRMLEQDIDFLVEWWPFESKALAIQSACSVKRQNVDIA